MNEHMYTLKKPLKYAYEGDLIEAKFIELIEPNSRLINNIAPVKANLVRGISWAYESARKIRDEASINSLMPAPLQEEEPKVKEENKGKGKIVEAKSLSAHALMQSLDICTDCDTGLVMANVMMMVSSGCGKVDGETRFTKPMVAELHPIDTIGITGYFLENFILPYCQ